MNLILFSLLILFCLIVSVIEISERRNFYLLDLILVLFYILLITFRSINGTPDTLPYFDDYNSLKTDHLYTLGNVNTFYKYEYGYTLISQIFKIVFGDNIRIFFGFLAFINLVLIYFSFKRILKNQNLINESILISENSDDSNFSYKKILFAPMFSIYISYFGFMYSGIVLRQGIALSIFLSASSLLMYRKYFWGILLMIVLMFFHNMAILSLLILFFIFTKFTFKKTTYYIYLTLVFCLYLTKFYNVIAAQVSAYLYDKFNLGFLSISPEKITAYLGNTNGKLSSYSLSILVNFIFSFIAIRLIDSEDKFQHKLLQINLFAISALSLLAGILALSRAIDYYSMFNILLFYIIIFNKETTKIKFYIFSLIVISNAIIFYRLAILG
jgi:hypothetical protein